MLSMRRVINSQSLRFHCGFLLGVMVGGFGILPVIAQEREEREDSERSRSEVENLQRLLGGLERGMEALRELGRVDQLEGLERIAADLKKEIDRHKSVPSEREVAVRQLRLMRVALDALLETEREEAVDLLEHAIHARELALEGRRDEEALSIREGAPSRGQQVELLRLAAQTLRELDRQDAAAAVGELAEQLSRRGDRSRDSERPLVNELLVMRRALPALLEAERRDAADLLRRAIRAREVRLAGRRDVEARDILDHAPPREHEVEILLLAARLWRDFGDEEKAQTVARLARGLGARPRAGRERPGRERERRREAEGEERRQQLGPSVERIERLEERLSVLQEIVEQVQEEIEKLKRRSF